MMKKYFLSLSAFIFILFLFVQCNSESKKEGAPSGISSDLKAKVNPEQVKNFEDLMEDLKHDPESIKLLGHYAYFNRNLELSAWLYSIVADKKPDDHINKSNLGSVLNEMYLTAKDQKDPELSKQSLELLRNAADDLNGKAAPLNNLGYALFKKYEETKDASLLSEAESFLRKALALEPDNATVLSHLAEVLATQNKTDEAVTLLNKVHLSNPFNGVFNEVIGDLGAAYSSAPRSYCDSINFHCDEKCPHSIIGRIQFVSCEMEQASQIMACGEGKPYITEYNCDEEMGDVPFLIPGLNSGFCLPLPYVKICIMLQSGGKVDYKVEFQVPVTKAGGINVKVEGSYEPSSGQSTVKFGTDVEVNLVNSSKVASELNKRGIGPLNVQVHVAGDQMGGGPIELKTYDAVIWN